MRLPKLPYSLFLSHIFANTYRKCGSHVTRKWWFRNHVSVFNSKMVQTMEKDSPREKLPLGADLPTRVNYRRLDETEIPANHPVRCFQKYFDDHKRTDGILYREDFDPLHIIEIMPWMQILEEFEPDDYKYRLFGTAAADMLNADLTGKRLRDIVSPAIHQTRLKEIQDTFFQTRPIYSYSELNFESREFIRVYRGMFPGQMTTTKLVYFITAPIETDMSVPRSL